MFAPQIAFFQPDSFITSRENKAVQTGKLLAHALGVPIESAQDLHEHHRQGISLFNTPKEFRNAVRHFFANPEELVFGQETAAQAGDRFNSAITQLLHQHQHHNLAIVAHGTVMTLLICRHNPSLDPITFWTSLQMPCAALIRLPDMAMQDLILLANP
jgi:broad specificity phosphatase PhoE